MNIPFDPTPSFILPSALIKNRHPEIDFLANESLVLREFFTLQIFIISGTYLVAIIGRVRVIEIFARSF